MPYQYHLPCSPFSCHSLNALPCPLSLRDYQRALYNLLSRTHGINLDQFPSLAEEISGMAFCQFAFINWRTDQLNSTFFSDESDQQLVCNIHEIFSGLTKLELFLHKVISVWLNRTTLWLYKDWLPEWQTMYDELRSLLSDIKHLHCHMTRLLCQHPDLPIWADVSHHIEIEKQPGWVKNYVYQEQTFSGVELRAIFDTFIAHCAFPYPTSNLAQSFFFQSQILKLLTRPVGIHFIVTINKYLTPNTVISVLPNKSFMASTGLDCFNGVFKPSQEVYKVFPGHPVLHASISIPHDNFEHPTDYFDHDIYFGVEKAPHFTPPISLELFSDFISIAHELRHVLNYFKGKRAPNVTVDTWSNVLGLFTTFEEYRTICYSTCCEQVLLADFGLPIRITHNACSSVAEAIELLLSKKFHTLLARAQLESKFDIIPFKPITVMPKISLNPSSAIGTRCGAFKKLITIS